jgi:hypothetical protein
MRTWRDLRECGHAYQVRNEDDPRPGGDGGRQGSGSGGGRADPTRQVRGGCDRRGLAVHIGCRDEVT